MKTIDIVSVIIPYYNTELEVQYFLGGELSCLVGEKKIFKPTVNLQIIQRIILIQT